MIGLSAYLIVTLLMGILANRSKSSILKQMYLLFIFSIACLYTALRGASVGIDTNNYLLYFDKVSLSRLSDLPRDMEPGYTLLNYVLSRFFANRQMILVFEGIFISYSFYRFIFRYSKDVVLSAVIFVSSIFTITLNVSRQFLSIAVILYMISYIIDKKMIKAIILLVIAVLIHNSAVVFAPLLIFTISKFSINFKNVLLIGIGSLLMIPLYSIAVEIFSSIFSQYARFFSSMRYMSETDISWNLIILFGLIFCLALICLSPITLKKGVICIQKKNYVHTILRWFSNEKELTETLLFFLMFIEYVVLYFISRNMLIASRLLYHYQISLIILIPNLLYYLNKNITFKLLAKIMYFAFVLYFMWFGFKYFESDPHGVLPYVLFFE